jgi:hypothetical protein
MVAISAGVGPAVGISWLNKNLIDSVNNKLKKNLVHSINNKL